MLLATPSECQLHTQLNDALAVGHHRRDSSELGPRRKVAVGQPEIDVVEHVERLGPELRADTIGYLELLQQAEVSIEVSGPAQNISPPATIRTRLSTKS